MGRQCAAKAVPWGAEVKDGRSCVLAGQGAGSRTGSLALHMQQRAEMWHDWLVRCSIIKQNCLAYVKADMVVLT